MLGDDRHVELTSSPLGEEIASVVAAHLDPPHPVREELLAPELLAILEHYDLEVA